MARSGKTHRNERVIFDVLYGFIPITEWEEKIINSPFFQRLRWIKQLGFANYIFPGAEHNRFAHVIGVMHSMDQMLRTLGLTELICTSMPEYESLAVALATDARRRSECRLRLLAARNEAALFDSQQHTRYLEAAYRHMWQLQLAGEPPKDFSITAEGTVSPY